ncbi:MAG: hypothetical protein ACLT8E_07035 [Akkermansia sp.]
MIPLFFQVVLGYSALQSGMSLIPLALSNLLAKRSRRACSAIRLPEHHGRQYLYHRDALAAFYFISPGTHELILLGSRPAGRGQLHSTTCMNTLTLIDLLRTPAPATLLSTIMVSIAVSIAAASLR